MNKFFASLLCCSLTLPLLLQAETSQAQSPSQKKFTRKQLSQAANTPAKKPEEKKKTTEPKPSHLIYIEEKKEERLEWRPQLLEAIDPSKFKS